MAPIDEILPFVRALLELETAAQRARLAEPNERYIPALQALNDLFSEEMAVRSGITRGAMSDADLEAGRRQLSTVTVRRLYEIREHRDERLGRVFGVKLGGAFEYMAAPDVIWYVAETSNGPRVVGSERACLDCGGVGEIEARTCIACGGRGWEAADGIDLSRRKDAVDTRRID